MSINHINIVVGNLEQTADFFQLLGFTRVREKTISGPWLDTVTGLSSAEARYAALFHPDSPVRLELLQFSSPEGRTDGETARANQIGYRHIALEVKHIEETAALLERSGYPCRSAPATNSYGHSMCYVVGPDGILVELLQLKQDLIQDN